MESEVKSEEFNEWNPGLTSDIPSNLIPFVTLFDSKNSYVDAIEAKNASQICGLKPHELNSFTVSRLVLHETLIRVSGDLLVSDGPNYEDLGISLRGMTKRIIEKHINSHADSLEEEFNRLKQKIEDQLYVILARDLESIRPKKAIKSGFFVTLFGRKETNPPKLTKTEFEVLAGWQQLLSGDLTQLERACLEGLCRIVGGILGLRGRLTVDDDMIVRMTCNLVCNSFGSLKIGEFIEPIIKSAVELEGYKFLPYQEKPFVMNVKGASAAGKSTLRPLQKKLAERLGLNWEDFALLSTDYWRKYLLDYDSMGKNYKYAAMLTGQELEIIDQKLDRHIAQKANKKELPHMLIDRFRFDSFSADLSQQSSTGLLSRFGHTVYLFFIITPPTETVVRAWHRGQKTGRYKSVDDLLYHNVEAYTGIPQMYIRWAKKKQQKIHIEFIDNSVEQGEIPKTVAFGWNDKLVVLEPSVLRLFNKYRSLNINAHQPDDVYVGNDGDENNFLNECIEKIDNVYFVDPGSKQILGHTSCGKCVFENDGFLAKLGLRIPTSSDENYVAANETVSNKLDLDFEQLHTVGTWT